MQSRSDKSLAGSLELLTLPIIVLYIRLDGVSMSQEKKILKSVW